MTQEKKAIASHGVLFGMMLGATASVADMLFGDPRVSFWLLGLLVVGTVIVGIDLWELLNGEHESQ